jgi:asparagine synthase (glutamine-hydrolysing)
MCGVVGIFHRDGAPASPALLRRMMDAVAHRGPDGEGLCIDHSVGLGHRRLAIIDLSSAGHQPMATPDGRYVLSYNGEVYNFRELRTELEAAGHRFRSNTDSEVVLNAFAAWGKDCVRRLNGIFAFALWDKVERELTLARDRFGAKPLYYWLSDDTFLFGSEIKAILAHGAYRPSMDCEGLFEYLTFQNFFTERTLFKDIRLLQAAHILTLRSGGGIVRCERYWDYDFFEPTVERSDEAYVSDLDTLFRQAVGRQLVGDVEIGAYLSGGLDSGAIVGLATPQLAGMRTFTCGFDLSSASGLELRFDERPLAEQMSYHFSTEHYEMVLKAGDMERIFPRLTWHQEEPRVGQSYPNFYIAQLASKFVKVVLSGTGGDELFAGYPWRYYRAAGNGDFESFADHYYAYWQRLIPGDRMDALFAPVRDEVRHVDTRDIFRAALGEPSRNELRTADYVNMSQRLEAKTFLQGLLLVDDKFSMASSMETRVPFLDNDLVEFAMSIPLRLKLKQSDNSGQLDENDVDNKRAKYFQRTSDGKVLLRRMLEKHIPRAVIERAKQGFSAPDASWFKGESIQYVQRRLLGADAHLYEFLDRDIVRGLVGEHLSGQHNRRLLIWSLLSVESWCERFLHGTPAGASPPRAALPGPQ